MQGYEALIKTINSWGDAFCGFARIMSVQVSLLVGLLLLLDWLFRKHPRVTPGWRYGLWLLVLVKLILPPSLAFPTGIGYWIRPHSPIIHHEVPLSDVPVNNPRLAPDTSGLETPTVALPEAPPLVLLHGQGTLFLVWLLIVSALLLLLLRRYQKMRREVRLAHPAPDWLVRQLNECRRRLYIRRFVSIALSEHIPGPAVCGFRRPVLLLPQSLPEKLSPEGLKVVLGHELVHVQRRDTWVHLAQSLLQILYFYHPLVWVANRITGRVRELAVDETVLTALQLKVTQYTDTLIHVAEMAYRQPAPRVCSVGLAESRESLKERITNMLQKRSSGRTGLGWVGPVLIVTIGAILVPMGQGRPASTEPVVVEAPALPENVAALFELDTDSILDQFGRSPHIFYGDQKYTLDNLPEAYFLAYEDVSFCISDGVVVGVTLLHPRFVFGNGVSVGATEAEVIVAFGSDYEFKETPNRDFLEYEHLGISFEIYKPERIAREINVERGYGDPGRLRAYANASDFAALLPQRIAEFDIDTVNVAEVKRIFGEPVKYIWGRETFSPDNLPKRYIAVYPAGFQVCIANDSVWEIRLEEGPKNFVFMGALRIGSSLSEALEVLGEPVEVVEGKKNRFKEGVLYRDIAGWKGHCYYHRPDHQVRLWFTNYKIMAIYLTNSEDDEADVDDVYDENFAALLTDRVASLDIDNADRESVEALFGKPLRYIWGDDTFTLDSLPKNYILQYPCDFGVWIGGETIKELRFSRDSKYAYAPGVQIGASVEDVLAVLGDPVETVVGKENECKDGVLYRDIEGNEGHCYYHRSDKQIRVWFWDNQLIAIYMTRSDFPIR